MIPYSRDPQQTIPVSAVKIIGLGGAGANMLERIALDGMEGAELLALNTDIRTLNSCIAKDKIQLGANLTKGLGAGGDPDLGRQSVLEAEDQIREAIKGRRIIFLCTGLGGGTGSGAAPIVTRIAREEGAFVVVFATMPFAFEGKRRRDQAETSLNELAVLSNALVTFENNRMGELVLAKQGIHEAFAAADHMVCESIKAVIRLVIRPGLINVGLDDLMSALRTNRSRCLFGSGIASGKDRATSAFKNALGSPLLDQGALLKEAQTVLVHVSGGENLTLFEIELLMQRLHKFVPPHAHILFGAAIDPAMGDSLSITLISALPEDTLSAPRRDSIVSQAQENPVLDPSQGFTPPPEVAATAVVEAPEVQSEPEPQPEPEPVAAQAPLDPEPESEPSPVSKFAQPSATVVTPSLFDDDRPFAEPEVEEKEAEPAPAQEIPAFTFTSTHADLEPVEPAKEEAPDPTPPWSKPVSSPASDEISTEPATAASKADSEPPKLKLGIKSAGSQSELSLDSAPRGRFEGESPNVFEGEDLDLPPFLRKKK